MGAEVTDSDLRAIVAYWQPRLRLSDWDIQVEKVHPETLDCDWGQVKIHDVKKRAMIQVSDQEKIAEDKKWHESYEQVILHEMLHIVLTPLTPEDWKSPAGRAIEVIVHQMAETLLSLAGRPPGWRAPS